jgi:hypothetical protein
MDNGVALLNANRTGTSKNVKERKRTPSTTIFADSLHKIRCHPICSLKLKELDYGQEGQTTSG